ncbi:hypothetical protein AHAS_Ahas16G0108600 [Arachis hypogaea]
MAAAATVADAIAHGQNFSAATIAHVPVPPAYVAQDEDDERLAEMYWEETLEDAETEAALDAAAAEFEASLGAGTQPQATTTLNPSPNIPHIPQVPPPIRPPTTKIKRTKRSTKRPPPSQVQTPVTQAPTLNTLQQPSNASVRPPTVSPHTMQ